MVMVSMQHTVSYALHANAWTETLEGLFYLIKKINELEQIGNEVSKAYLVRLVIISSSYLSEQIFAQASKQYFEDKTKNLITNSIIDVFNKYTLEEWFKKHTIQKIGIDRALKEHPLALTGKSLDFAKNPLQSLILLMKKRNEIIHKISDLTCYANATDIAYSALYTSIESSKIIESHFFDKKVFSYQEWLDQYSLPSCKYFNQIISI